jgi:hypothetical protein
MRPAQWHRSATMSAVRPTATRMIKPEPRSSISVVAVENTLVDSTMSRDIAGLVSSPLTGYVTRTGFVSFFANLLLNSSL